MKLYLQNIHMSFGKKKVLNGINLELSEGIYGLLGPNGAGKTTLINILVGIYTPTKGQILIDGIPKQKLGKKYYDEIGYMPQYAGYYDNFTVYQMLDYYACLKGVNKKNRKNRINELLKFVNMYDSKDITMSACSGGMKQRIGIASALLNDPSVIILDEPTAGLDPRERIRFRNLISQISENKIVIISTHIVSDIETIAKEVVLIGNGEIVKRNTIPDLCNSIQNRVNVIKINNKEKAEDWLTNHNISNIHIENDIYTIRYISDNIIESDLKETIPKLDDVYLYYFGKEDSDHAEI